MLEHHYGDLDPEYILDEGGFGSGDLFAPGKLVFGISVAEKKILWLKLRAEGVAGHGSQPHEQNPNDRLVRALAHLLGEPLPSTSFTVLDTMKSRVGAFAANKFNNAIQHSTISLTSLRSGVGDLGAERIVLPARRVRRNHVHVVEQQERLRRTCPLQPRDENRSARRGFVPGDGNPLTLKDAGEKIGRLGHVAGRVGRVDPDVRLNRSDRFRLQRVPVRSRLRARSRRQYA